MSHLTHLPPSDGHRKAVRRSGFDLDDPHRRHPVRNAVLERLRNPASRSHDPRADQLLRARKGHVPSHVRGWAATLIGAAAVGWSDTAFAFDLKDAPSSAERAGGGWSFPNLLAAGGPAWAFVAMGLIVVVFLILLYLQSRLARLLRKAAPMDTQMTLFNDPAARSEVRANWRDWRPRTLLRIDGASRTGQVRTENQDAFAHWIRDPLTGVMVLCDGAGGMKGGKQAAESAVAAIMAHLKRGLGDPAAGPSDRLLLNAIEEARAASSEQRLGGVTTAIVASMCDGQLTYATLGDGALAVVWPDGMVTQLLAPHHTAGAPSNIINAYIGDGCRIAPRVGSVRLEAGCTVLLMSDGASDLFPFDAFGLSHVQQVDAWRCGEGFAGRLLRELEAARDAETGEWLHHDNMTLVAAHLERMAVTDA